MFVVGTVVVKEDTDKDGTIGKVVDVWRGPNYHHTKCPWDCKLLVRWYTNGGGETWCSNNQLRTLQHLETYDQVSGDAVWVLRDMYYGHGPIHDFIEGRY